MCGDWQEGRTLAEYFADPMPLDYHNGNIQKKNAKIFEPLTLPRLRRDQLLKVV